MQEIQTTEGPGPPLSTRLIFRKWERLRILYNAILLIEYLLFAREQLVHPRTWFVGVTGCVFANLCYFAGPVLEAYTNWLGFRSKAIRPSLFALGTIASMILAGVYSELLPLALFSGAI